MGLFDRLGEHGSVLQSKRKMHLFYFTYLNQILTSKDASKDMLFGGLGSLNQSKLESCPFDDNLEQRINYLLDTVNDVLPTMRLAGRGANLEVSSIRKVEPTLPYREDYWRKWGQRNSIEVGRVNRRPVEYWGGVDWRWRWDGDAKSGGWDEYLRTNSAYNAGFVARDNSDLFVKSPKGKGTQVKSQLILNYPDSGLREYEGIRVNSVEAHHPFEREGWRNIQMALDVQNYDRILFFPRIRCNLSVDLYYYKDTSPGIIVFIPENTSAAGANVIEIGNRGGGYYEKAWDQQIGKFPSSFSRYKTSLAYLERRINKGRGDNLFGGFQMNQRQRGFLDKIRNEFSVIEIRLNKGVRNMLINWPHGMDE